jgi:hypothetical protein
MWIILLRIPLRALMQSYHASPLQIAIIINNLEEQMFNLVIVNDRNL